MNQATESAGLERLRKSRQSRAERECAEGEAAGKQWALDDAEEVELERVAALSNDEDQWTGEPDAYGWAKPVMDAIHGEHGWNRSTAEEFGEVHFGKEYPSPAQVRGFVLGAKEVFEQV